MVYTVFDRRQDIPAVFYNLLGVYSFLPHKGGMRVGDENVKLIEQSVSNNTQDIRELKKKMERMEENVSELKSNQKLTQQSITHIMTGLDELKQSFKGLDNKMDKNQEEQFQTYKTYLVKVAATITASIIVALIVFALNIK